MRALGGAGQPDQGRRLGGLPQQARAGTNNELGHGLDLFALVKQGGRALSGDRQRNGIRPTARHFVKCLVSQLVGQLRAQQ